ncbi:MAG: hypothetical protein H6Q89_2531 [Myxococcaceae bacterium]|nr:hypothetical protein [Myxococcaceae bacterium]
MQSRGAGYIRRMRALASRPATYSDLEQLPETVMGELIDGKLYTSPRPAARHVLVSSALGIELGPFQRSRGGPGGWWILDEPELHFGKDVLVPDLSGWRRERMPALPEGVAFTVVPDWVCEVLSPSTAKLDLELKLPLYAAAGVEVAWLIEPVNHTLQIFRRQHSEWVLQMSASGDERVRAVPFEAIELDLSALWSG